MSVHARAPVRIDFAGGWSDVPDFADREGGKVVNAAISLYTHVECLLGGGKIRLHAEDLGEHVTLHSAVDIVYDGCLDLHKAALRMLPVSGGIEILSRSDVPPGSGLGASASLDVSLLAGLARCRDEDHYDSPAIAEMGFALETAELKLNGGRQDQYAAAVGGVNEFGFEDGGVSVRSLGLAPEAAAELEACAMIVYTGQSHFSSRTHERVWNAYHAGDDGVTGAIRAMRDLVPGASTAVESRNWRELARVVDENWTHQQRLDPTISTEGTQYLEGLARRAGAWGVKATGAGAGGCLLVVADPESHRAIREALEGPAVRVLDWKLDFAGVTRW